MLLEFGCKGTLKFRFGEEKVNLFAFLSMRNFINEWKNILNPLIRAAIKQGYHFFKIPDISASTIRDEIENENG